MSPWKNYFLVGGQQRPVWKIKDFIQRFPLGLINSINRNSDSQEVKGIEGNIKLNLGGNTSIRGALTFQDLRIKESIQNPNLEGSRSPNIPYYFTNLSINKEFKKPFGWSADFNIYGNYLYTEQYFVRSVNKVLEPSLFGESPSAIRSIVIPTQHQVTLGFTYKFHNIPFSINVEGINMLNEELYDDFRIPRPLRNYRLKLTYRL